jgi:hypothetical protein
LIERSRSSSLRDDSSPPTTKDTNGVGNHELPDRGSILEQEKVVASIEFDSDNGLLSSLRRRAVETSESDDPDPKRVKEE